MTEPMSMSPQQAPDLQDQVRRIVADFNAGRHDAARQECAAALASRPGDPMLNHLMAAVLFAVGDTAEASGHISASLAARPDAPAARQLATRIARAIDLGGDGHKAEAAWQAVASADPASREAAARLGRIMYEDGRLEEALPLLERAATPDAPASAWFDLGLVRHDLRDHAGAATAYRAALERDPGDAEAAVNLGIALQDGSDMAGAMKAYAAAYTLRSDTFGTIAMALTSAPTGGLWLDREALRRRLTAAASTVPASP